MKFRHRKEDPAEQQQPAASPSSPPDTEQRKQAEAAPPEAGQTQQPQTPPTAQPPSTTQTPPAPPQPHPAEEKLLRLKADFDNLRRRFDRERQEMVVLSNERLIRELLPVLDHFELALAASTQHKTEKAVHDGFNMVLDQFRAAIGGFGLTPVDAHGKPFDPKIHEAIAHQPSAEVPDHTVMLQTRRGYMLGERLLRPAQVIVSSGPPQPPAPSQDDPEKE